MSTTILLAAALALLPLQEREVTFEGAGGLELAGSLSLPGEIKEAGAPGVLLLPGSGPTDRDGNQPPLLVTDLLLEIAEHLDGAGFATLRFDKRAAPRYRGRFPSDPGEVDRFFSWESFAGDARAAFAFLGAQEGVDPARLAVLGHSEGGLIALELASDAAGTGGAPAALVLAGTPGRSLDEVIRVQVRAMLERQGAGEEAIRQYLADVDRTVESVVERGEVPGDLPPGLQPLFPAYAPSLLRSYFTLEPTALARRFSGAVLVIHGEMDVQVPAQEHTGLLLDALKEREGKARAERWIAPGASHNLKPVSGPLDPGFAGEVPEKALERIASFLEKALR